MMDCQHANQASCRIAESLCGLTCTTRTDPACAACDRATPPRHINTVTVSLAVAQLRRNSPDAAAELLTRHRHLFQSASLQQQAWSVTRAIAGWIADAGKFVDRDHYAARLAACDSCDHRDGWRCNLCRCFVSVKAKLPRETCPAGRWPAPAQPAPTPKRCCGG